MAFTTINKSTDYFNTKLYTGNGSTNAQTGVGFQPDSLWVKCRSDANGSQLFDVLRTTYSLSSNATDAESNRAVTKIILDWQNVTGASKYRVYYRYNNGDFTQIETTSSNLEILNTEEGDYEFRVFVYNALNQPSANPSVLQFTAVGQTAIPEDVSNLTLEPINDEQVRLRWTQTTSLDVKFGGQVYIRHSPRVDGSGTFANSTDLIEALSGASTEAIVPAKSGEYVLKFRDLGGRFSSGDSLAVA